MLEFEAQLALVILHKESTQLGLEINWAETKLHASTTRYLYLAMMWRLSTPLSILDTTSTQPDEASPISAGGSNRLAHVGRH